MSTTVFARGMAFEDRCREAAELGITGFDLVGPQQWPILKKYGITPTMYPSIPGREPFENSTPPSSCPKVGANYHDFVTADVRVSGLKFEAIIR